MTDRQTSETDRNSVAGASRETTIEVKNVYKIFGQRIDDALKMLEAGKGKPEILKETGCTVGINNATFDVYAGEVFVIMGLSGSGKSTIIRCLNRLIEPTSGSIVVEDTDIVSADDNVLRDFRRHRMSMVFQHFGLLPHRSVMSNVAFGLELQGIEKDERNERAMESLRQVGLASYSESMVAELSGGMQQRVGLARALCTNPQILLMDEAFSALDPLIRTNMQDELLELQAAMHKTIVFITHDLDEALKIGDRIAIMNEGVVVQVDTPEGILTNPANEYVRNFVENVDRTKVIKAETVMHGSNTINMEKDGPKVAVRAMEKSGAQEVYVLDARRKLIGMLTLEDAATLDKEGKKNVEDGITRDIFVTSPDTPVGDLLHTAFSTVHPIAVTDENGTYLGVVDRATIVGDVLSHDVQEDAARKLDEPPPDKSKGEDKAGEEGEGRE